MRFRSGHLGNNVRAGAAAMPAHNLLPITIVIVAQVMGQVSAQAQPRARANEAGVPQAAVSDPVQVERGKALYGVRCTFCHGADARGGEGGPNLVRSGLVLNDIKGELIAPVLQNGRAEMGMRTRPERTRFGPP